MDSAFGHRSWLPTNCLRVLRRRDGIVLVCALLVPATAFLLSAREPARYQASGGAYLGSRDLAGALTATAAQSVGEASTKAKAVQVSRA